MLVRPNASFKQALHFQEYGTDDSILLRHKSFHIIVANIYNLHDNLQFTYPWLLLYLLPGDGMSLLQ